MLLNFGFAKAQHLELINGDLYKGTQKELVYNINDMWDLELFASNVKSYVTYRSYAYWRCTVIVLYNNGQLYKLTINGENKGLIAKDVSDISISGDFIEIKYTNGSVRDIIAAD